MPVMAKRYWIIDNALVTSGFRKMFDIGELWSWGIWVSCIAIAVIIRIMAILRITIPTYFERNDHH